MARPCHRLRSHKRRRLRSQPSIAVVGAERRVASFEMVAFGREDGAVLLRQLLRAVACRSGQARHVPSLAVHAWPRQAAQALNLRARATRHARYQPARYKYLRRAPARYRTRRRELAQSGRWTCVCAEWPSVSAARAHPFSAMAVRICSWERRGHAVGRSDQPGVSTTAPPPTRTPLSESEYRPRPVTYT
jgi:hypothetical protein